MDDETPRGDRIVRLFGEHIPEPETPEQAAARLAKLSPLKYDQIRDTEAERLGVRVSTLDAEVKKARGEGEDTSGRGRRVSLPTPEPWPEPVPIGAVLAELEQAISNHVILSAAARTEVALWIAHTWVFDQFDHTPRLSITSPTKRCGKSTLLTVLMRTTRCPLKADNISASGVFRTVEALSPLTLLIDEADTHLKDNEELRGVLNSGFEKSGSVIRVVEMNGQHQPVQFRTFAPVAFAAIGANPDTLEDRSAPVRLQRKSEADIVRRFRESGAVARLDDIARKLCRWANDRPALASDPAIPDALNDREGDISVPLLSIADAAGGEWPGRARRALVELFTGRAEAEGTAETGTLLLSDIETIFRETGAGRIPSAELATKLGSMEERPWSEWKQGKPITAPQLARALKPFRIRPHNMKMPGTGTVLKAYQKDHFADAWTRYVPPSPPHGGNEPATCYPVGNTSEVSKNEGATTKAGSGPIFGKDVDEYSDVAGSGFKSSLLPERHGSAEYDVGDEVEL